MLKSSKHFSKARTVAHQREVHKYILGKNDINESFIDMIDNALEANELAKISMLKTCFLTVEEVSLALERQLKAQVIQKIGRTILIYRESKTNKTITKLING